jgi:hypothetical protein
MTNTQIATSFDFGQRFETREAADQAATAADLSNFRITADQGEWMIIDLSPATRAAPKAEAAPKAAPKAAKEKAKGKKGKGSLADRNKKTAEKLATPKAAPKKAAAPANGEKDMHYSRQNLPSKAEIESGLKGMNLKDREGFKAALKGELPSDPPFSDKATHDPFRKSLAELDAMRAKGDYEGLKAWKGGKGTRMTCSSTIPLGRYHQKLLLAFAFRKAKAADRKAKKEGNGAAAPAAQPEQPTS